MPKTFSRQRTWLLRGAALVVSFGVLALVEAGLRLGNYGGDLRLFVPAAEDVRYLRPNPRVIDRYFASGMAPALAIEPNYFLRDKPADAIRVVVQGGSSAAGFPYGASASLASLLAYRLRHSFPERPVEVIDTAMSAATSHVLFDFADEIIALEPDAVLIYAGHNEFLGLFGVGSVYSGAGSLLVTRLALGLHRLRLYRLVRELALDVRLLFDEPTVPAGTTLMAVIAREREIPLGSDSYRRGIGHFERNLSDLIDRYADAGIPVLVGSVASNLKDQPPFIAGALPVAADSEAQALLARLRDGEAADIADATLRRLDELAAAHANAGIYFAAGTARAQRGEYFAARADFVRARDLDLLRFRAPTDINDAIRAVAADTAAVLVDVEQAFADAAPDGLTGSTLMLEHVHPTAEGYLVLSDAFYRAMADAAVPAAFTRELTTAEARAELPIFDAERYFGRAAAAELQADFPFAPAPRGPALPVVASAADALGRAWFDNEISWLELAEGSRELVAGDPLLRAVASQRIADALPFRSDLGERAAADWLAAGRPAIAARYRQR